MVNAGWSGAAQDSKEIRAEREKEGQDDREVVRTGAPGNLRGIPGRAATSEDTII